MINFDIIKDKKKFTYWFPEFAKEITCELMIKFQREVEVKKPNSLKQYESIVDPDERREYLSNLDESEINIKWLSYFLKEIRFFIEPKIDDDVLSQLPVEDNEQTMSVYSLRNYMRNCMNKCEERDIESFELNGETFVVPETPVNIMHPAVKDYLRGITVGEYAVASQLYNAFNKQIKGSIEGLVYMIAVLCRKHGEKFPLLPEEQNKFIEKRARKFKQLDLDTALNVGFFLAGHKIRFNDVFHVFKELEEQAKRVQNMETT